MLVGLTTLLLVLFGYAFEAGNSTDLKNQKKLIDFSKIDLSFFRDFLSSFQSFAAIFTPEFGGILLLLALSIGTYFFVEKLNKRY
jgi:hypothetical protein